MYGFGCKCRCFLEGKAQANKEKEAGGIDLIFHTNTESGKTDDLEKNPAINMSFYNSTGEWASLSGDASIITDREAVRKYYSPSLKAWLGDLEDGKHDGGPEDPRIGIIKITAKTATYAVSRSNALSRGIEVCLLSKCHTKLTVADGSRCNHRQCRTSQ